MVKPSAQRDKSSNRLVHPTSQRGVKNVDKNMDNNLTHNQRTLLLEAARRWLKAVQADKKKNITDAWTGLGFRSEYKCVSDAGLMEDATNCPPMTQTWRKLTERGAQIVQS